MHSDSNLPVEINYFLEPGFIYVASGPACISTVLGTCVSVCLYDKKLKIGGMNHFQLPYMDEPGKATARYGNAATLALARMMLGSHTKKKHLEAQIFGGATSPNFDTKDIGQKNVMIAKRILSKIGVPLVSEDVGGERGRKIVFDTHANEIAIMRVDKLRKGDWYPYLEDKTNRT